MGMDIHHIGYFWPDLPRYATCLHGFARLDAVASLSLFAAARPQCQAPPAQAGAQTFPIPRNRVQ